MADDDEPTDNDDLDAVDVAHGARHVAHRADGEVPRDDRVRHARELPVEQVDVRPADLGERGVHQDSAGLEVRIDAAANLYGTRSGTEAGLPAILFGSHIDTVATGGRYDGNLDVGIVGCRELVPDAWTVAEMLHTALDELVTCATARTSVASAVEISLITTTLSVPPPRTPPTEKDRSMTSMVPTSSMGRSSTMPLTPNMAEGSAHGPTS